jgi:hypothetical protein
MLHLGLVRPLQTVAPDQIDDSQEAGLSVAARNTPARLPLRMGIRHRSEAWRAGAFSTIRDSVKPGLTTP